MKVFILSAEFPPGPGGIGTHAFEVARNLHALGHDVRVLAAQHYVTEAERDTFNAAQPFVVESLERGRGGLWAAFRQAMAATAAHGPDVVLATGSRAVWLAAVTTRLQRLPMVAVGHGTEFGDRHPMTSRITRWAFSRAAAVICVSRFTERMMLGMGVRPGSHLVIPNGADERRFFCKPELDRAVVLERLGLPPTARLLLTVGSVTDRKGQDVVIRALPHLRQHVPDVHYVAAGLPTQAEAFTQVAASLGVAGQVHFAGRVAPDHLLDLMNACDVFVMVSKMTQDGDFEGYGIAVVEAALCGAPAVVSKDSGLAEAVEHGVTGLCVPEKDPEATAEALRTLLQDDALRAQMGDQARRHARSRKTWRQRVAAYEEALAGLVAGGTASAVASTNEGRPHP